MRRLLGYLVLLALVGGGWLAYEHDPRVRQLVDSGRERLGGAKPAPKSRSLPPAPVRVASTERRDVPIVLEGVGNVQARSTIAIKARVDGQLMEAAVQEGQLVKKGELLFRLDSRPFEAQLQVAEANLAKDEANLEKALSDQTRYGSLALKGISPKTKLEEAETSVAALRAAIRASRAAVDIAKLNLEYATIKAPIDGRVGSILLAAGNMVKANDTQAILMLTEVRPINVAFALPEQHIGELRARLKAAEPLVVEVSAQGDEGAVEKGELFFINNAVDMTTGTILVMARFANPDERLVPGQFVKARVRMTTLPGAVVAPSKAIQINQRGSYVWVVKPDMTAEARSVTIGPEIGTDTVVSRGLEMGERVVTDGQLRLFPGAKVVPADDRAKSAKVKG
ncbi:MAG: efflux RND transporter periplasmic adaptor subunit [Hyphomicrobiaceae bacterium]